MGVEINMRGVGLSAELIRFLRKKKLVSVESVAGLMYKIAVIKFISN